MDDGHIHPGHERTIHIAMMGGHISGVLAGFGVAATEFVGWGIAPIVMMVVGISVFIISAYLSLSFCPTAKHIALTYEEIEVFEEGGERK